MVDKPTVLQIFGSLMQRPMLLHEQDKYNLTVDDFYYKLDRYIILAMIHLSESNVDRIRPIDIENFLSTNPTAATLFKQQNGIGYLQDAELLSDSGNFDYYYTKLKKVNLLNSLEQMGVNTSEFYIEDKTNPKAYEINQKFELLTVEDIINKVKKGLLNIEGRFLKNDTTEIESIMDNLDDLLTIAQEGSDIGAELQGEIFNKVVSGARFGTFVLRSAGSGTGKTRNAVGDACYLAFPFRFNWTTMEWEQVGGGQKVLFIATEQDFIEIRKMVIAYISGLNESKFRFNQFTPEELKVVKKSIELAKLYKDNFFIVRMPNPTIGRVKTLIRESVLTKNIQYVFFDYIHIAPSLLDEFKGFNLRNDEILLMFSTALKDLAVELNIFVMSSTQLNAKGDESGDIKNEAAISGSRSIINKCDVGVIISRLTKLEEDYWRASNEIDHDIIPNLVTDVYKVRSGEYNQIRIWSYVDLGTLRKTDLFATDSKFMIQIIDLSYNFKSSWNEEEQELLNKQLEFLKEGIYD